MRTISLQTTQEKTQGYREDLFEEGNRILKGSNGSSHCYIQIKQGLVYTHRRPPGAPGRIYDPEDIALLIKTDILHKTPNGRAVKRILGREFFTFGHEEYKTIAGISVSHIYNIRNKSAQYQSSDAVKYRKTKAVTSPIGDRRKPENGGRPGFLRVDSVHQGDRDKEKGVYHINIVDEVTQWEVVGCVPTITDEHMIPLLQELIEACPFIVLGFHSDNGSEYINGEVASLLQKLLIDQTKSRSRRTNDNALVESKNGAVIRKHMGRNHIPKKYAGDINTFYKNHFITYLNYHRVCLFPTEYRDKRGKIRKKYEEVKTPYEKLKSLPHAHRYLKEGITFEQLDDVAYKESDNEYAEKMQKAKLKLLKKRECNNICVNGRVGIF